MLCMGSRKELVAEPDTGISPQAQALITEAVFVLSRKTNTKIKPKSCLSTKVSLLLDMLEVHHVTTLGLLS